MAAAAQFRDGVAECPRRCGFVSEIYNESSHKIIRGDIVAVYWEKFSVLIVLKNIFLLVSSLYIPLLEYPASRLLGSHNVSAQQPPVYSQNPVGHAILR